MGPDNNGMKITLFRSPFVVAYSNSSSKNKGPLQRLVISALCNTVELHISAAFEKHLQISASDMSTTWIWLNLQTPQTLPVLCRGKKKISAQQACTSCDTIPCITCRGSLCHSEWPELCSMSSTPNVAMLFGRRSAGLRFELYRFHFKNLSDSNLSCTQNFVLSLSLSLSKLRSLFFSRLHSFTLTLPTDHTFYRHRVGTRIAFCGLFTLSSYDSVWLGLL